MILLDIKTDYNIFYMSSHRKDEYKCPCCGYQTQNRSFMRKHFYALKKPCPKTKNVIDLTNEIKEFVLANRIWTSQ